MHYFLKCIRGMKLCMLQTVPLSIIRSFALYTQQWYMSCRFADSLRVGSGQNCSSILILLASCQQNCMTFTIAVCTVKTPDDGQRNCPKHVDFHSKNKFEKLVHLVGFIIRKEKHWVWFFFLRFFASFPYLKLVVSSLGVVYHFFFFFIFD